MASLAPKSFPFFWNPPIPPTPLRRRRWCCSLTPPLPSAALWSSSGSKWIPRVGNCSLGRLLKSLSLGIASLLFMSLILPLVIVSPPRFSRLIPCFAFALCWMWSFWCFSFLIVSEGKSTLLSLVKSFDSVLSAYEGFCNLKQVRMFVNREYLLVFAVNLSVELLFV